MNYLAVAIAYLMMGSVPRIASRLGGDVNDLATHGFGILFQTGLQLAVLGVIGLFTNSLLLDVVFLFIMAVFVYRMLRFVRTVMDERKLIKQSKSYKRR